MSHGARLAKSSLLCALVSGGVMAADAAATPGDLTQKPGAAGCWSAVGLCSPGTALAGARSVTISPDGRSAYVASQSGSAVAVFDRAEEGTLTQKLGTAGCISETGAGPCEDGTALDSARSVTVSPDGASAYVASGSIGAVAVFDRAVDGTLSQKAGAAACVSDTGAAPCPDGTALGGAFEVTVSPDGRNAYVASNSSSAVAVFDRAADGTLTQKAGTAACISDTGGGPCGDGTGLGGALGVVVSPDGKSAYVASFDSGAVAVFDRAADGTLTQKPGTAGCVSDTGAGTCVDGTALDGASAVTVSPDGASVYVSSQNSSAVAVFDRAADGTLTQKDGTAACISDTGAGPCADGTALDVAASVAVSPDGQSAYVASFDSDAVAVLDRAADGTLTQKPGTAGCVSDSGAGPCLDGAALDGTRWVTVSPDGRSAYAASVISGAVAVFDREPPAPPPPPPPPPPAAQPENLVAPEIRSIGAGAYSCDPGTWRNVASPAGFTYSWFRHRPPRLTPERLASTQTYTPPVSVYGDHVFCSATVAGPSGPVTAKSAAVFFSSAGLNTLPPAYGDVRVRGIDVFQTVQASAGAQMYGYRPNGPFAPGLCGGGTPTSWRLVRFGGGLTLCDLQGRSAQYVDYEGVTRDRYKLTTAIVYVDVAGATAAEPDLAYDLELSATRGGRTSLGEPVVRRVKNPPRSDRPWVETFERDTTAAFDSNTHGIAITLPSAWTSPGGSIQLHARLRFPSSFALGTARYGTRECDDPGLCVGNDTFTLNDVPFTDHPQLLIGALELRRTGAGQAPLPAPGGVLAKARRLFPGGDRMIVSPYRTVLDISGVDTLSATAVAGTSPTQFTCNGETGTNVTTRRCRFNFVSSLILGWITENPARPKSLGGSTALRYDAAFGVHDYDDGSGNREPGWANGSIAGVSRSEPRTAGTTPFFTATAFTRPLSAAAHELGHILTAPHASGGCNANVDADADGKPDAGAFEPWPEVAGALGGEQGRLQGVKFTRTRSLRDVGTPVTADGPYSLADGATFNPSLLDLMSYCAGTGDTATADGAAWLSARNWNRFTRELGELGVRVGFGARATAAAAAAPASSAARAPAVRGRRAFAVGSAGSAGGKLLRVVARDGQAAVPDPVPSSPFRLRSLDPSGRVLLEAGVAVRRSSEAGDDDSGPFAGPVAAAAAAVELVHDGQVLDRLTRSRSPAVKLRESRRGTRVRSKGKLTVRWQASDPDGDALNATIDFSADNGRTWRTVSDGPSKGRAAVPGSILAGSKRARIRLAISDGFSERRATSRRFVAQGTPPRVQILTPQPTALVRSGERTLLTGSAFDDLDHQLPGKALTWFAGKKRLGSGRHLRVRLPRGARRLTLVARDRTGRKGRSTLPLRVEARRLRIVDLDVPLKARRKARTVTVHIKASAAAVLTTARRRFRVGTTRTKLTIPLPARPAVGVLRVPFKLSPTSHAVQGNVKGTFSVART